MEQIYWASTKFADSFIPHQTAWLRHYYYFYLKKIEKIEALKILPVCQGTC